MKHPATLELYVDYLLTRTGQVSAQDLSALLDGRLSHDHITRTIAQPQLDQRSFWKLVKPTVRQLERDDGCIAVDDFLVEKPHSTPNELIQTYWSHSEQRYVQGINVLNFLYISEGETGDSASVPVAFEVLRKSEHYVDAKSGREKQRSPKTKNELLRERLHALVFQNEVRFRYVLWDTWFCAAENMVFVVEKLQKHFVGALKSNRKAALLEAGQKAKKSDFKSISQLDLQPEKAYRVRLQSVPFDLLLVKIVYKNMDGSSGVAYLVSSDLGLDPTAILQLYQKRWKIEVSHKSVKQNLGIAQSPTKMENSQANHIFAAMCGLFQLEKLKLRLHCNHFALKKKIYLTALKAAWKQLEELKGQPVNELGFHNLATA